MAQITLLYNARIKQMEQITQIILIILIAIKAQSYMLLTLLYIDFEISVVLKLTNIPSFFPVSFK